jgi:OMF family outer membrane factor
VPNPLLFPTKPDEVRLRGIQPITLKQAIELAQRNNRALQVTQLQLERSRAALQQARAALYPTLSTQVGVSQSESSAAQLSHQAQLNAQAALPAFLRQPVADVPTNQTLSGTVSLSYNVFTSGQRSAEIAAAERQARSAQLQVEAQLEQLRLDVSTDYYNLQAADESVRIQRSAVRNSEASLRDTLALERAGLGTRFDVLRAQVQLASSNQQLTNALASQQKQRRQLAQRLSISQQIDLAAADPVEVAGDWKIPLEDSIVLAFKQRAELEQQLAQREASEQSRRAALAALGPTLTLTAQYEFQQSFNDGLGIGNGYSLAANIRWNLYDGGAAAAAGRQQELNKDIAEAQFADTRNQIRQQVENAYYDLRSSFVNIGTTTQAVTQATEALRLARLRFQAGVGTQTDVINAENDLTNADGNRINAILGYNRALASMIRAVSNLPIASGATTPQLSGAPK